MAQGKQGEGTRPAAPARLTSPAAVRIVFFGTPAFAVPSLLALLAEGASVVGVVTQPDRPQGRSRSTLVPPPVKVEALRHGIPVFQPDRPRGDVFLTTLSHLEPTLGIVVAYGHILRPEVLAIPPLGMINVHASLLPRHRGAAPIQAALLAGDQVTGISIMQLDQGMDTGPILHRVETPILDTDTTGTLTTRLADLGGVALVEALALLRLGRLQAVPQEPAFATHAPKIRREVARITWDAPADLVARHIRAFDPDPGAWTLHHETPVKLFAPAPVPVPPPPPLSPGEIRLDEGRVLIGTGDGAVAIESVQPAGRPRMKALAWLRGRTALSGDRLA